MSNKKILQRFTSAFKREYKNWRYWLVYPLRRFSMKGATSLFLSVFLTIVFISNFFYLKTMVEAAKTITRFQDKAIGSAHQIYEIEKNFTQYNTIVKETLMVPETALIIKNQDSITNTSNEIKSRLKILYDIIESEDEESKRLQKSILALIPPWKKYTETVNDTFKQALLYSQNKNTPQQSYQKLLSNLSRSDDLLEAMQQVNFLVANSKEMGIHLEWTASKKILSSISINKYFIVSSVLFICFTIFLFTQVMIHPILQLRKSATRILKGDYGHNIELQTFTEIDTITDAINAMTVLIEERDRNMSLLMEGIPCGVFFFSVKGKIVPQCSPQTFHLFPDFAKYSRVHDFYGHYAQIEAESLDRMLKLLENPKRRLDFEDIVQIVLPTRIHLNSDSPDEKIIDFKYYERKKSDNHEHLIFVIAQDLTRSFRAKRKNRWEDSRINRIKRVSFDKENYPFMKQEALEYLKRISRHMDFHFNDFEKVSGDQFKYLIREEIESLKSIFNFYNFDICLNLLQKMELDFQEEHLYPQHDYVYFHKQMNLIQKTYDLYTKDLETILQVLTQQKYWSISKFKLQNLIDFIGHQPKFKHQSDIIHLLKELPRHPAHFIFARYKNLVQDLNDTSRKDVALKIDPQSCNLSFSELAPLNPLLAKIIRNSIGHGIETPFERLKKGKSKYGHVTLLVMRDQSDFLHFEIGDDGQGIDVQRLSQIALESGSITKDELSTKTHDEKLEFIFIQDFFSVEGVSNVLGSGPGMSTVKKEVEKIQGSIKVASEKDKGTRYFLKIPPF